MILRGKESRKQQRQRNEVGSMIVCGFCTYPLQRVRNQSNKRLKEYSQFWTFQIPTGQTSWKTGKVIPSQLK